MSDPHMSKREIELRSAAARDEAVVLQPGDNMGILHPALEGQKVPQNKPTSGNATLNQDELLEPFRKRPESASTPSSTHAPNGP